MSERNDARSWKIGPDCVGCQHFDGFAAGFRCAAFPEGIPREILDQEHGHLEPYPGDRGILYEPVSATELARRNEYWEARQAIAGLKGLQWAEEHGQLTPELLRKARRTYPSWLALPGKLGLLTEEHRAWAEAHGLMAAPVERELVAVG